MSSMRVMNPRVRWFAEEMRRKLRENTHKTESRALTLRELKGMLNREVSELADSLIMYRDNPQWADYVIRECADVANFAMMIADKVRATPTKEGEGG